MWKAYIEKTKHKAPSKYLEKAVENSKKRGNALDVGSGSGADTKFLVSKGFQVEAMDAEPFARECIQELIDTNRARFYLSDFTDFPFKTYALINASYALPFIQKVDFLEVWQRMTAALEDGGLFVGELFGTHDSWNREDGKMNFHGRDEVEELLSNWRIVELVEEDKEGRTATGTTKRWHVFHIIAKKI